MKTGVLTYFIAFLTGNECPSYTYSCMVRTSRDSETTRKHRRIKPSGTAIKCSKFEVCSCAGSTSRENDCNVTTVPCRYRSRLEEDTAPLPQEIWKMLQSGVYIGCKAVRSTVFIFPLSLLGSLVFTLASRGKIQMARVAAFKRQRTGLTLELLRAGRLRGCAICWYCWPCIFASISNSSSAGTSPFPHAHMCPLFYPVDSGLDSHFVRGARAQPGAVEGCPQGGPRTKRGLRVHIP